MNKQQDTNNGFEYQENISTKKLKASQQTIEYKSTYHIQQTKQIRTNKITRFGPWRNSQIRKFCTFLEKQVKNIQWFGPQENQIFLAMSKYISSRNVHQCKLLHKKLLREFKTNLGIVSYYKQQNLYTNKKKEKSDFQIEQQQEQDSQEAVQHNIEAVQSQLSFEIKNENVERQNKLQISDSSQKEQTLYPTGDGYFNYRDDNRRKHSNNFLKLLNNESIPITSYKSSNSYLKRNQQNPFAKLIEKSAFFQEDNVFLNGKQQIFEKQQN